MVVPLISSAAVVSPNPSAAVESSGAAQSAMDVSSPVYSTSPSAAVGSATSVVTAVASSMAEADHSLASGFEE